MAGAPTAAPAGDEYYRGIGNAGKRHDAKGGDLGNTKIIADPRENTIIVLGNDEVKQKDSDAAGSTGCAGAAGDAEYGDRGVYADNDANFGVDYLLHYPSGPLANLLSSGSSTGALGSTGFLNGQAGAAITNFTATPIGSTLASAVGRGTGLRRR